MAIIYYDQTLSGFLCYLWLVFYDCMLLKTLLLGQCRTGCDKETIFGLLEERIIAALGVYQLKQFYE